MIDLKPTPARLREHWRYHWWMYALFTVLAVVAANMLFTVTTPKVPYELKVEVLAVNAYMNDDLAEQWQMDLQTELTADQKEVSIQNTPLIEGQEMVIMQVMMARFTGREGTVLILPSWMFQNFAQGEAFINLQDIIGEFNVPEGTDLTKGEVVVGADEEENIPGEKQLCGIPLDQCKGLGQLLINEDMVLCLPVYAEDNWENAKTTANWLLGKVEAPQSVPSAEPSAPAQ